MTRPLRLFINGFGRIGRSVLRQLMQDDRFDLVGVNDIAPLDTCAYLLRYDSVYGPFPQPVETAEGVLRIAARALPFHRTPDLATLDLRGVDVVLECTGQVHNRAFAEAGLRAGATNVLISGPSKAADCTLVLGANADQLGQERIVSNASCTTNAIAPLLSVLDRDLGIDRAHITTIHCYTGSQPTVDQPGASLERSRAAAVSMVPTTTSADDQILKVLPQLQDRLSVAAVRVPCLSVSSIDATLQITNPPATDLNSYLTEAFAGSPLVGLSTDPCVSSDFRGRPESLILALPQSQSVAKTQIRLFGWYDNEWGFSARMLDMAERMAARDRS